MAWPAAWSRAGCSCCPAPRFCWGCPSSFSNGAACRWWAGLFLGLQCAVLAILGQAVWRLAGRCLRIWPARALALTSFVALAAFGLPFPAVVAAAAALGACLPGWFGATAHGAAAAGGDGLIGIALAANPDLLRARAAGARRAGAVALGLWLAPVAALWAFLPGRFADIALFFSKMAVVTFGGAYAVLAYVAQDAVHGQHWLSADEMLSGLGLAETTPGPLILVLHSWALRPARARLARSMGLRAVWSVRC